MQFTSISIRTTVLTKSSLYRTRSNMNVFNVGFSHASTKIYTCTIEKCIWNRWSCVWCVNQISTATANWCVTCVQVIASSIIMINNINFEIFLSFQVVTRSWYHSNWSFVVFYAIWTIFHQLFDWWFTCVRSILLAMFAWKNATIKVNYRHTCGSTNCIICVIGAALRTATNQTLRSICFGNTEPKACCANDVYTKSGRTFITSVYHRRHSIVKRVACHLRRQWHWKFINVSIRTTKLHIRARRMDVTKSSYHAACCWNTLADIICRLRKSSRKILSLKRRK